jgi:hypothetical protein
MPDVHIHKFESRYRLPRWSQAERRRLDQLRAMVLDRAFELALRSAGLPEESELCIRYLRVPVHFRLNGTDTSLAMNWATALAEEITRAIVCHTASGNRSSSHGGASSVNSTASDLVIYQSRRQALMDMALGTARVDLRRAWAWRQLGLWRSGDDAGRSEAISEMVSALCAEPLMIVPVLRALAETGCLRSVAKGLTARQWEALGCAALSPLGATRLIYEAGQGPVSSRALRDALRVIDRSGQLRAINSASPLLKESMTACRAVAALAMLEAEPVLLRAVTAPNIIGLIAGALRSESSNIKNCLPESVEPAATTHIVERASASEALPESLMGTDEEEAGPPDMRVRALTRYGGLLFLLGVVEDLKLPEEILSHALLGARPFLWVMHQLALTLVSIEPYDPAALAFAGLPPGATPPSAEQEAMNEVEAGAIKAFAMRIIERLHRVLEGVYEPESTVLEFVCGHRAEIVADPGWIEAKFSMDDVSTEIRRAGLDLDPGYIPWLGVVLRFVYE